MEVPAPVIAAAKWLVQHFGLHIELIGKYDGKDAYTFNFPDDAVTGYPYIFLFKDGDTFAETITGEKALDIIASLGVE